MQTAGALIWTDLSLSLAHVILLVLSCCGSLFLLYSPFCALFKAVSVSCSICILLFNVRLVLSEDIRNIVQMNP